ncbi:MAG: hypothetical protein WBD36_07475 [Bacteroidota bacterium]
MRLRIIVLVAASCISGCRKEGSPVSLTDQQQLSVKVENDSLIYALTIPKSAYFSGDSLNAYFSIQNKTSHLITFIVDSSAVLYYVRNDSSRVIMSYRTKGFSGHGFFAVLPDGGSGFWITDELHDEMNARVRAGSYTLSVGVDNPAAPTLTLSFTAK